MIGERPRKVVLVASENVRREKTSMPKVLIEETIGFEQKMPAFRFRHLVYKILVVEGGGSDFCLFKSGNAEYDVFSTQAFIKFFHCCPKPILQNKYSTTFQFT